MLALWGKRTSGTGLKVVLFFRYWCPKHSNAHVIVFDSPSSWMIASNSRPQYWNFRDRRKKRDLCYRYLHSFEKGRVLPGLKQICSFLILHQRHISQSFQANRPHGIACFNDIIKIKHLQKRRTVKVLAGNYLLGDLHSSHTRFIGRANIYLLYYIYCFPNLQAEIHFPNNCLLIKYLSF